MIIRKAKQSDLSQIIKLYLQYQKEEKKLADVEVGRWMTTKKVISKDIQDYILEKDKFLSVLINEDIIAGFILGSFKRDSKYIIKNYGSIDEIYIIPEMRGKGYSSKLKDEFVKWFKERKTGKGVIVLYVMPKNKVAQKAYEKWGFEVSDLKLAKEIK